MTMMNKTIPCLLCLPFVLGACTKIETELETIIETVTETVTEVVEVEQETDTLHHVALYTDALSPQALTAGMLPEDMRTFAIEGVYAAEGELFCANFDAKRVDIFSLPALEYTGSIAQGLTTRSVFADADFIYVTGQTAPQCHVAVYDRRTREYVTRLGNGDWQYAGCLVHPSGVAADSRYIYVRHEAGSVKVYERNQIVPGKKEVWEYCYLSVDGTWGKYQNNHNFTVDGDVLYLPNTYNNTVYLYDISGELEKNKTYDPMTRLKYENGQTPWAFAATEKYYLVGTRQGGTSRINAYVRGEGPLQSIENPISVLTLAGRENLGTVYSMTTRGDSLFISSDRKQVFATLLKERCYDVITPEE